MTDAPAYSMDEEIEIVMEHKVSCDGGGGALGHPKVYLEMGGDGQVVCGYCGKRFILKHGPVDPNHF